MTGKKLFIAFFCSFCCITVPFAGVAGTLRGAKTEFQQTFQQNGGFPMVQDSDIQKIIFKAPYDSVYLSVDPAQFANLVNPTKRNKINTIAVTGWLLRTKPKSDGSLLGWAKKLYLPPAFEPFAGKMTLRGGLSLDCGKPSFKIDNDAADFTLKLKGFCGAKYGVEEKLFDGLVDHMSSPLVHPYHVFLQTQHYYKLFINQRIYGLYLDVPELNKEYLTDNGLIMPDKKNTCITKMGRFLLPQKGKKVPISSRLEILNPRYTDQDIDFAMENKYGNETFCRQQSKNLLAVVNKKDVSRDDVKKIAHTESILLRGMLLRYTDNHISLTHNYLLVYHNGKFGAGLRDVEDFKGCKKQPLTTYRNKDNWQYNKLFGIVLDRYIKNQPDRITFFDQLIQQHVCAGNPYLYFKNTHLQYVLADRFLWNLGNMTPVSQGDDRYIQHLSDVYQQKIDFTNFFKEQYQRFEEYFGIGTGE